MHQVVVDFSAQWCGPCKKIAPDFEKIAARHANVCFCKIDVDENTETAEKYKITSMPTFLFFREGTLLETISGADLKKLQDTGVSFCVRDVYICTYEVSVCVCSYVCACVRARRNKHI
jgi:thioredoxin 1